MSELAQSDAAEDDDGQEDGGEFQLGLLAFDHTGFEKRMPPLWSVFSDSPFLQKTVMQAAPLPAERRGIRRRVAAAALETPKRHKTTATREVVGQNLIPKAHAPLLSFTRSPQGALPDHP